MSLLLVLAAFAIVSVAILASIQAQSGTTRDEQSKGAIQAAEAGFSDALLRYNTYSSTTQALTPAAPCISQSGVPSLIQTNGWCPEVDVPAGGGTARYWVRFPNAPDNSTLEVFSVGSTTDSVTRRVDATAVSAAGAGIFSDAAVKAQSGLTLDSNAEIHAGSQSGGDITLLGGSAKQCGPATVGLGKHLNASGGGYYTNSACTPPTADPASARQAALTLPPVNQGDAPTNNNDINITNAVNGSGVPADLITGKRGDVGWTGAGTNPGQRQLSIGTNTNMTLTGTKYSLCSLSLSSNSAIYIAAGVNATIFFDSPEHCGLAPDRSGAYTQFTIDSSARISYTLPTASVALLFVGSTATPPARTAFLMHSNTDNACVQNFVVYAPLTDITLDSNSHFCGALAGNTVLLNSRATVQTDAAASSYRLPNTPPHYQMSRLVECSAAGSSPQATGC